MSTQLPLIVIAVRDRDFKVVDINSGTAQVVYESGPTEDLNRTHLTGSGRPPFRPFGIEIDKDYIYVASNDCIGKFDRQTYQYKGLLETMPMYTNTHQILKITSPTSRYQWAVCNTAINCIGLFNDSKDYVNIDVTTGQVHILPVPSPENCNEQDVCHLNSLAMYDDGRILFCRNNNKTPKKLSDFCTLDLNTYEIKELFSAGFFAHNVCKVNSKIYTLSTGTGRVLEADMDNNYKITGHNITPHVDIRFLRGMDVFNGELIFSDSIFHKVKEIEENQALNPFNVQALDRHAYICVLNPSTKEKIKLPLPGTDTITDLRLLID